MADSLLSRFAFGEITVDYLLDEHAGLVGLRLLPSGLVGEIVPHREWVEDFEYQRMGAAALKLRARPVDSLVQAKIVGDDYPNGFAQGWSLRNSATTWLLKYKSQVVENHGSQTLIRTFLRDGSDRAAEHRLTWGEGDLFVQVETIFHNQSERAVTLELLSSFSLSDLTPFHAADAPNRLVLHRLRSAWSAEGRLHSQTIEELNLERSWQDHAIRNERFGQMGSMPVRGFFPFAAVEDTKAGVLWGAQLAWAGSWQFECYRQSDALILSGGLADREFGQWTKTLQPGESLTTPSATLSCVHGDLDALCHRLTSAQVAATDTHPSIESDLPIICNEFCTTWGNPMHENLEALAKRLQGSPVRYLVIDAGWYDDPGSDWGGSQGAWNPSAKRFPEGLAATATMIRDHGFIPGLWFEMEVAGAASATYNWTEHQLQRDGGPITTGRRHFWDFRDPWVADYLAEKVIAQLRAGGFGYAKFDYNETIGLGVDGAESPAENLREHLVAAGKFFDRIRTELPDLVIEGCSSGGHRLEPSMLARSSMSSFSDAHESLEIPIIAANMHRAMLPRQSQIWAVLRADDDEQRLVYSLAATFLGRMCLSGDLHDLSAEQWSIALRAMELYQRVAPIIKHGRTQRFGPTVRSYRHSTGWQAVLRSTEEMALLVVHTFGDFREDVITVPLPQTIGHQWQVTATLTDNTVSVESCQIHIELQGNFYATVILLGQS